MQRLLVILMSSALLLSCNPSCLTKDGFIDSYDAFVENALDSKTDLTDSDEKRFESFTNECYEKFHSEMTNKEKIHFWKQTIKYQSERHGYDHVESFLSPDLQEALERDLETFTTESKEELVRIFQEEVAPELNNAIDEVVKGIEEIGESLKDWLNDVEK